MTSLPKDIKKHAVESSNLEWVAYDKDNQNLFVQFKSSGLYVYHKVPEKIFTDLLVSGSKGRYHALKIKYNFDYERLR